MSRIFEDLVDKNLRGFQNAFVGQTHLSFFFCRTNFKVSTFYRIFAADLNKLRSEFGEWVKGLTMPTGPLLIL